MDTRSREEARRRIVAVDRSLQLRTGSVSVLHKVVEIDPDHPLPELRSVLMPIDPASPAEIKSLNEPMPVVVKENEDGEPVSIIQGKRKAKVTEVLDMWKVNLWWPLKPIERTYYELEQSDGKQITVFKDKINREWFRQDY